MKLVLLVTIFLFVFKTSWADTHQAGTFKIESIRLGETGTYVRFNPAPSACQGGDQYRMHAVIPNDHINADKLTSTLLAA